MPQREGADNLHSVLLNPYKEEQLSLRSQAAHSITREKIVLLKCPQKRPNEKPSNRTGLPVLGWQADLPANGGELSPRINPVLTSSFGLRPASSTTARAGADCHMGERAVLFTECILEKL